MRYVLSARPFGLPGVLHAISTQEILPGCSSHAKRCLYSQTCKCLCRAERVLRSSYIPYAFVCINKMSGSRLLFHAVSSIVPSAARIFTVVFGMGTGVPSARIATRQIFQCIITTFGKLRSAFPRCFPHMRTRQKRNPYSLP